MGAQPIRIDFEGATHEFPPDFTQQDIQKALLRFHGAANGSQPGLVSIGGEPTGVKVLPSDDEERLAEFKKKVSGGGGETNKLAAVVQKNLPTVSKALEYLPEHPEWMATGPPIVAEGLGAVGTKAAQIFQNLKNSGAGMDALGFASPRTRYAVNFLKKLKDAIGGGGG